jgi:hypothetical protein
MLVTNPANSTVYEVLDREPPEGWYGPVLVTAPGEFPWVGYRDNDGWRCECEYDDADPDDEPPCGPLCHGLHIVERGFSAEGMFDGEGYAEIEEGEGMVWQLEEIAGGVT